MPQHLVPPAGGVFDIAEVAARLDEQGVDLGNADNVAHCTALLAGLARHPTFVADRVIAALKQSFADQLSVNRYSAQVFLLHRSQRRYTLRANLWPAATDYACISSGSDAFVYGIPHDHNFSFLTVGYDGPGYVSDFYEYDAESVDGCHGEPLDLRFVERSVLGQGQMMLYRAHRDIHSQLAPEALSISLNILDEGDHVPWRDQYIVDVDHHGHGRGTIVRRPTLTPGEMLLRCAVHLTENGRDLADQFAKIHPVPRVRANAIAALAAVADREGARAAILERGLDDADARVRSDCAGWLATQQLR